MEKIRIGKRFGFIKVMKYLRGRHHDKNYRNAYECLCDCGKTRIFTYSEIVSGHNYSCGCRAGLGNLKTGISTSTFYRKWDSMRSRCYRKNSTHYASYGGRGIKIDWKIFEDFKKDMYKSYLRHRKEHGDEETTIDRIDVNGDYSKSNCRWATNKQQGRNRRNNVFVEYKGNKIVASAFCELTGLNKTTVCRKIKLGWSGEKIIKHLKK